MKLKHCVEIQGFDAQGQRVYWQIMARHKWLEELYPLIDHDAERARLKISRIDGIEIDDIGDVEKVGATFMLRMARL